MSVLRPTNSWNSSISSTQYDACDDAETQRVKNLTKETLRSRIFLGRYIERRLINERIGYRDIVVISAAEVELKKDLLEAQSKLRNACPSVLWIGITETDLIACNPPGSICLCTEIDNQPFGPFWFQIKSLKFRSDEIIVTLKCLRHITEAFLELEPILTGNEKKIKESNDITAAATESLNETYTEFVETLKTALSISNLKDFITFLCAFIIATFTGSTTFINFLGNFILALIRELSILIRNSTPMFLGMLDFLSKIVGGFYILLAMFFKPSNPPSNSRSVAYYERMPRQNVVYDDKHFD